MAINLRLDDDDAQLLRRLAEVQGVSQNEAVLRAIREAAARHAHLARVAEASLEMRERWADVLDRLGTV